MIQLRDLLREFDYGKKLFADPDTNELSDSLYKRLQLMNFIGGEIESPNTADEELLLTLLIDFTLGTYNSAKELADMCRQLLPLKNKFPKILDPADSHNINVSRSESSPIDWPPGQYAWRGATIPIDMFKRIAKTSNTEFVGGLDVYRISSLNPGISLTPRSIRGVHSFSYSYDRARFFTSMTWGEIVRNSRIAQHRGRVPCIIGINLTAHNLLFHPGFMNTIGEYQTENEILYIGNTFKPDIINIDIRSRVYQELPNADFAYELMLGIWDAMPENIRAEIKAAKADVK